MKKMKSKYSSKMIVTHKKTQSTSAFLTIDSGTSSNRKSFIIFFLQCFIWLHCYVLLLLFVSNNINNIHIHAQYIRLCPKETPEFEKNPCNNNKQKDLLKDRGLFNVKYTTKGESRWKKWSLYRNTISKGRFLSKNQGKTNGTFINLSPSNSNTMNENENDPIQWHVQLVQNGIKLNKGIYSFCFSGFAQRPGQMVNVVIDSGPPRYDKAGWISKEIVLSQFENKEYCLEDIIIDQPLKGQRAVIEMGLVEGNVAICKTSLRRCGSLLSAGNNNNNNNDNNNNPPAAIITTPTPTPTPTPTQKPVSGGSGIMIGPDPPKYRIIPTKNRGIGVNLATGMMKSDDVKTGDHKDLVAKLYSMGARNFKLWSGTLSNQRLRKQLLALQEYNDIRCIVQTYEFNPEREVNLNEFYEMYFPLVTGFVIGNEPESNIETLSTYADAIESYVERYPNLKFTIPFANNLLCSGGTVICPTKKPYVKRIADAIKKTDSTFCVNIYSWFGNDDNPSRELVDALVNQWYMALEDIGHDREMFGVCENGWPTSSVNNVMENANLRKAKQFNDMLREYTIENEMIMFLFEANDELNKPTWASVEPYWGILHENLQEKYSYRFSDLVKAVDENDENNYISVMTYNVLNSFVCQNSDIYSWDARKSKVITTINNGGPPDVIFLQEATGRKVSGQSLSQIEYIGENIDGNDYLYISGTSRGDWVQESVPMYYNNEKLNLLTYGERLFSQTQTDDGLSCGENDDNLPRGWTYGHFEIKTTSKRFWAFGSHFPKKECKNLQKADADELMTNIQDLVQNDEPYIIVADWNNGWGSQVADEYIRDELDIVLLDKKPTKFSLDKGSCSYNGNTPQLGGALDTILTNIPLNKIIDGPTVRAGRFSNNNIPASDHAAVHATFSI